MPRPAIHDPEAVLDATRALILEAGPRGVAMREIARRSGAPSGSVYHRFGSRDRVVARAWLRAVARFQRGYLSALRSSDAQAAVDAAIAWSVRFALAEPDDTRLLLRFDQRDLLDHEPDAELAARLSEVNRDLIVTLRGLTRALFGGTSAAALERTSYAVVDLPGAVLRRHVLAGTLTMRVVAPLQAAARAILASGAER